MSRLQRKDFVKRMILIRQQTEANVEQSAEIFDMLFQSVKLINTHDALNLKMEFGEHMLIEFKDGVRVKVKSNERFLKNTKIFQKKIIRRYFAELKKENRELAKLQIGMSKTKGGKK